MITQELLNYIKQQQQQGISREEIKNKLLAEEWSEEDIDKAFKLIEESKQLKSYDESKDASLRSDKPLTKTPKKPVRLIVLIILGVIIALGIFGYFYFRALERCPERITQRMFWEMSKIKSLEYIGQITTKIEIEKPSPLEGNNLPQLDESLPTKETTEFLIDFKGAVDRHNPNDLRAWFDFEIAPSVLPQNFGIEARIIKNIIYLKLRNIPDLDLFDLTFLHEQWVEIDIKVIKEQLKQLGLIVKPEEAQEEQRLSPEQIKEIKQAFIRAKIFKIVEKLPSEEINGINLHRYRFILNRKGLIQFVVEIDEITKQFSEKELGREALRRLKNSLQRIETAEGEFWIGKKDFLLYKFLLDLNIKEVEETRITVQFKNHNKPVQIDVPAPVKTIEEVLVGLLGGLLPDDLIPDDLIEDLPPDLLVPPDLIIPPDLIERLPPDLLIPPDLIERLPPDLIIPPDLLLPDLIDDLSMHDLLLDIGETPTEFCYKAITTTQLRKITGKERFIFKDIKRPVAAFDDIKIKVCEIQLMQKREIEGQLIQELSGDKIIVGFFPKALAYDEIKEMYIGHMVRLKTKMVGMGIEIKMETKEIKNIGEKAFLILFSFLPLEIPMPEVFEPEIFEPGVIEPEVIEPEVFETPRITFLDADINQVIGIVSIGINYETLIEFAKQVEKNLK